MELCLHKLINAAINMVLGGKFCFCFSHTCIFVSLPYSSGPHSLLPLRLLHPVRTQISSLQEEAAFRCPPGNRKTGANELKPCSWVSQHSEFKNTNF